MIKQSIISIVLLLFILPSISLGLTTNQEKAKQVFSKWKSKGDFIKKSVTSEFYRETITFNANEHITTDNTYRYTFIVPKGHLGVLTVKPLNASVNPDIVLANKDETKCRLNSGKEIIIDSSSRLLAFIFDESGKGGKVEVIFHTINHKLMSDNEVILNVYKYFD